MNILILSTQYNRYGGAATCAYETHRYFLSNQINSLAIFFDNSILNNSSKYNPDNLSNVYACKLLKDYTIENINLNIYDKIKTIINEKLTSNFIILGFNYLAPLIGKLLFKNNLVYYMITGTCYINNDNIINANQLINEEFDGNFNPIEKKTIEMSDYIIPNSNIMVNIIKNIYKINPNKIYDLHEIYESHIDSKNILTNSKLLTDSYIKTFDVIYISSNFTRKVKNAEFAKKIFFNDKIKHLKKLAIGKNSRDLFNCESIDITNYNITVCDFLTQEEIFQYIKKSKIILIPSHIESYSISCIEASLNTCIPLLSINVGCNNYINEFYINKSYDENEWVDKINIIIGNYIYHTKIFFNNYKNQNKILNLCDNHLLVNEKKKKKKKKVLFVTVDVPGIGGAATNTLNLVNCFKDIWDIHIIFIDNDISYKNDNLKNFVVIKNDLDVITKLTEYKNKIESNEKFDFIFCKNYKCLIYIKNVFKNSTIIFSPSGLRYVGLLENDYLTNLELTPQNKNLSYSRTNSVINFIKFNDQYLDFLALNFSDYIIPNSQLTFDMIKKIYVDEKKINYPIYTTNINLNTNEILTNKKNFYSRNYDVLFCSYSWSRKCKNYDLVKKLLPLLNCYKILLIGKKIDFADIENLNYVEYIENVPNDKIFNYFIDSKVTVITSYYDSNPNTLVESIIAGCNVVTSKNVGNAEFLDLNCVVNESNDINEWICKIKNSVENIYSYNGPSGTQISNDILKITNNLTKKIMTVGIYKINPLWDVDTIPEFNYFVFNIKLNDNFITDVVFNDIYFMITYKIGLTNNSNDINYIIIDETIEKNECYYVYKTLSYFEDYVKIWKIKTKNDLMFFNQSEYYFLRGNYHKFYKLFIPHNSKVIFYPATSFKHNLSIERIKPLENKYNVVLIHEDPKYKKLYENNKCILFKKFAPNTFVNYNLNRIYDLCFVATEKQITKNHNLFLKFLDYLDEKNFLYNIIFVGNLNTITSNPNYSNKFKSIKLHYEVDVSKNRLIEIYNLSINNLIMSGRDAFPRVVAESASCGCFNIGLDTLMDGTSVYINPIGVLLGDSSIPTEMIKDSMSYLPNDIIFDKIQKSMDMQRNHNEISLTYKKNYNIDNTIREINSIIQNTNISTNTTNKIILDKAHKAHSNKSDKSNKSDNYEKLDKSDKKINNICINNNTNTYTNTNTNIKTNKNILSEILSK